MEPRRLSVRLQELDLGAGLTEALRLLAAADPESLTETFVLESARIVAEIFADRDLDAVSDEELTAVAHHIVEALFGVAIAANEAVTQLVEATGTPRLDLLRDIETNVRERLEEN
jgi:hypothetical protein